MEESEKATEVVNELMNEVDSRFKKAGIDEDLCQILIGNIRRQLKNHLDDVRHIHFAMEKCGVVSGTDIPVYRLTPKNFFSALILAGEPVNYELVRGREKWVTPRGTYFWLDRETKMPNAETADPIFSYLPHSNFPKKFNYDK